MTEQRFNQLWDTVIGGPAGNAGNQDCETNGMSTSLADAIIAAEESGESLALDDWKENED